MITKEKKEKLKYFLESINYITHPMAPEFLEMLYDLGLIIFENNSKTTIDDVLSIFPKNKAEILEYGKNKYEESFIEKMANLLENKKWILINLKEDPGHQLINQLKHLAENNIMQLLDFKGKEVYNLKLPFESRIIAIVHRNFLEEKISYPYFFDIFGPVISL